SRDDAGAKPVDREWTHREMIKELRLLEPRRTVMTAATDGLLRAAVPGLPVAGVLIGALISASSAGFVAGAGVGLLLVCCGWTADSIRRSERRYRAAVRRFALYSAMPGRQDG